MYKSFCSQIRHTYIEIMTLIFLLSSLNFMYIYLYLKFYVGPKDNERFPVTLRLIFTKGWDRVVEHAFMADSFSRRVRRGTSWNSTCPHKLLTIKELLYLINDMAKKQPFPKKIFFFNKHCIDHCLLQLIKLVICGKTR